MSFGIIDLTISLWYNVLREVYGMEIMPVIWVGILILMVIIEALSAQLFSIWFVAGALAAAVVSMFVPSLSVQIVVFVSVSLVLLAVTRPFVKKLKSNIKVVPTNADRYLGKTAVVLEDIDETKGSGQVKVEGSVWSARAANGGSISKGSEVTVTEIKGVKLIVAPLSAEQ